MKQRKGREASGIHTGLQEEIPKEGLGAKFKRHCTVPYSKSLLPEQCAELYSLPSPHLKIAYSLSTYFFLGADLMTSQYVY